MNVNPNRRSIFVILGAIGIVVFISLVVWNFAQQEPEASAEPAAHGAPAAEPVAKPDVPAETPEDAAKDAERTNPARRIVHVPDTRQEGEGSVELEPEDYIGDNAVDFATRVIEKGLAGDVRMAGYIRNLTQICEEYVPKDGEALEDFVTTAMLNVSRYADHADPVPIDGILWRWGAALPEGPSIWLYPTEAQNRAHIAKWQRGCSDMGAIFTDKLRRELESMAQHGHVMARYMYAVWKPKTRLDEEALEQALQWQVNATEFSYANVAEGEPAGFLAFGESYGQAIFTSYDGFLSPLMLNAAYQCGYETPVIMNFIKTLGLAEEGRIGFEDLVGGTRERFDEMTAQLTSGCR